MKLKWNWHLLDMLRDVLLTISIMANLYLVKLSWRGQNESRQTNAYLKAQNDSLMKHIDQSDSLTHEMLRAIIEGQISTNDIQAFQLKAIDSLTKK